MEVLSSIQEMEFTKLFLKDIELAIKNESYVDQGAVRTIDEAVFLSAIELRFQTHTTYEDIVLAATAAMKNNHDHEVEKFKSLISAQTPEMIDEAGLNCFIKRVQDFNKVLIEQWHYADDTFPVLLKIFRPWGFTIKQIRNLLEGNIDKLKEELEGEYFDVPPINDESLFSIIIQVLASQFINGDIPHNKNISPKDFLFYYRTFEDCKIRYSKEYKLFHNKILISKDVIPDAERYILEKCNNTDIVKVCVLVLTEAHSCYWNNYLNTWYDCLTSPCGSLSEKERIYAVLNKHALLIEPHYKDYCDNKGIHESSRIVFTNKEPVHVTLRDAFKLPCDYLKMNKEKNSFTLKKELRDKKVADFEKFIYNLVEQGYLERSLDVMYSFAYRITGIPIEGKAKREKIDWHKEGICLRFLLSELCDNDGRKMFKEFDKYFNLIDEEKTLSQITAAEARNVKTKDIYSILEKFIRKN